MPTRPNTLRTLAGAALLPLALVSPAWGRPAPPRTVAAEPPGTLCATAGVLRGERGQRATVNLCAGNGTPTMSVTAAATCGRAGTRVRYACQAWGTWTARHGRKTALSGALPGSAPYPGPGTYDISATVRVRSAPAGVDLRGTVQATLTLTAPPPEATHRVDVDRSSVRAGAETTLTYTVRRDSDRGDGSARLGIIGEQGTGVRVSTADRRCVNPLVGRYPAKTRLAHALDCALTDLQPGHPATVVVRVAVTGTCSTLVSKLGYWMPQGQELYTGGVLAGPTVTCRQRPAGPAPGRR